MKRNYKRIILIAYDCLVLTLSLLVGFYFIKGYDAKIELSRLVISDISLILGYVLFASMLNVYSVITRFTDDKTSFKIILSLSSAFTLSLIVNHLTFPSVNHRLLFLGYVFSSILTIGARLLWRMFFTIQSHSKLSTNRIRTLVFGAGEGADAFISMVSKGKSDLDIVGLVDDDVNKQGTYLLGKKVLGTSSNIHSLVIDYEVERVVIAIPSLSGTMREHIVDICNAIPVPIYNMPRLEDMLSNNTGSKQLKQIDVVDLLGREEVKLDQSKLLEYFAEKTVLVTGAGGSIGSEICRQVSKFGPKKLLLLGHGENSIYQIHRELINLYRNKIEILPVIADIQDRDLIFELMSKHSPDVVYHAAAHKHVPLMEYNPREAVKNNIFGTKNVAEAAKSAGVGKFVMVSTDKAVNPPNVMGATKRVAEMIVTNLNEDGKTQFSAVRFGNVLGSRGSVVPLFKEQIAKGGPVTVTDFRMTRYFMTIPEASRLVIQSGYLANGGEIFVLDMGEPVLIKDLAKKVIKLSGHTVEEIGIVETGIRPGEKLYEELLSTEESVSQQIYEKIFVGKVTSKSQEEVAEYVGHLIDLTVPELKKSLIEFAKQE